MSVPYIADDYGELQDEPKIFVQAGFERGRNQRTGETTEIARVDILDHSSWAHHKHFIEARWCDEETLSEFYIAGFSPSTINIEVTASCYSVETSFGTAIVLGEEISSESGLEMLPDGRRSVSIELPVL